MSLGYSKSGIVGLLQTKFENPRVTVTDYGCAPCLRPASRGFAQAGRSTQERVTLLFRSGWILSFSFRLSQGMLNIFPLQGRLQTIGFLPSLHVLLRPH